MSNFKKKLGESMVATAGRIAIAPGLLFSKALIDTGPAGPALAAIYYVAGIALTSPVTFPLFVVGTLLKRNSTRTSS